MRSSYRRTQRFSGFTFIEIMLVVVIIGIMMAVVVPQMAGKTRKAKVSVTKQSMQSIKTALSSFEMKASRYPTTDEGLKALVTKPSDLSDDEWDGPYLQADNVKDSFGQEFIYRSPGESNKDFDLISKGPDKQEGTPDDVSLNAAPTDAAK